MIRGEREYGGIFFWLLVRHLLSRLVFTLPSWSCTPVYLKFLYKAGYSSSFLRTFKYSINEGFSSSVTIIVVCWLGCLLFKLWFWFYCSFLCGGCCFMSRSCQIGLATYYSFKNNVGIFDLRQYVLHRVKYFLSSIVVNIFLSIFEIKSVWHCVVERE